MNTMSGRSARTDSIAPCPLSTVVTWTPMSERMRDSTSRFSATSSTTSALTELPAARWTTVLPTAALGEGQGHGKLETGCFPHLRFKAQLAAHYRNQLLRNCQSEPCPAWGRTCFPLGKLMEVWFSSFFPHFALGNNSPMSHLGQRNPLLGVSFLR